MHQGVANRLKEYRVGNQALWPSYDHDESNVRHLSRSKHKLIYFHPNALLHAS